MLNKHKLQYFLYSLNEESNPLPVCMIMNFKDLSICKILVFLPTRINNYKVLHKEIIKVIVTGHRKRQIELYRRQTNTVSFSKFILKIFVQPTTIFDAWSSSQVLYESLGRSGNAGVGAEDQHSLIVPERC